MCTIEQSTRKQYVSCMIAVVGMDWAFIEEHCESVEGIMGELQDNTAGKLLFFLF